jgi:hypothetical protein
LALGRVGKPDLAPRPGPALSPTREGAAGSSRLGPGEGAPTVAADTGAVRAAGTEEESGTAPRPDTLPCTPGAGGGDSAGADAADVAAAGAVRFANGGDSGRAAGAEPDAAGDTGAAPDGGATREFPRTGEMPAIREPDAAGEAD